MGLYEAAKGSPETALELLKRTTSKERRKKRIKFGFLRYYKKYKVIANKTHQQSLEDKAFFYRDLVSLIDRE